MKLFEGKKQIQQALIVFLIIAAAICFALILFNFSVIWNGIKIFFGFFTPFYIGFIVAYLLNPLLKFFEKHIFYKLKKQKNIRAMSIVCTYISLLLFLAIFFYFVVPGLYNSVSSLVTSIPDSIKTFVDSTQQFLVEHPSINTLFSNVSTDFGSYLNQAFQYMTRIMTTAFPSLVGATVTVANSLINAFVGLIVSIYMLLSKERLIAQLKKILYLFFGEEKTQKILQLGNISHEKTIHFIGAQITISLIDAILIYLFAAIFSYPYPLLLAALVAVFNIIPFFGPILSCIPCVLIILIQNPIKALYFIIYFIIVQQIEANVFGPKIQGKKLKVSALWIIFGIFLFGGLFGVFGMIVGVPLISVIYLLLQDAVSMGLIKKGLKKETEAYMEPYPAPPPYLDDKDIDCK